MTASFRYATAAVLLAALCTAGCRNRVKREGTPTVGEMFEVAQAARGRATSFRAETLMDYWAGDQRQKGTVWIMAERGKKMRINAENPAGGAPALDFACDGTNFYLVDFLNDCQLTGPCDESSVERFFRVRLQPDDFIDIATGAAPLLGEAKDLAAVSTWDGKTGGEKLALWLPGYSKPSELLWQGKREGLWATIRAEVYGPDGTQLWRLDNKSFSRLTAGEQTFVVPGKSWFRAPRERSDVIIEWRSRTVNLDLDDAKFTVPIPEGLRSCDGA